MVHCDAFGGAGGRVVKPLGSIARLNISLTVEDRNFKHVDKSIQIK